MEFSLPEFPSAPGAQAAFVASAIAVALGLLLFFFPGSIGRQLGLASRDNRHGAIGELRACGGFLAGLALAALMFDQPVLYTALGIAFAFAAFGRILSLLSDRPATFLAVVLLLVQVTLGGASLYYLFDVFTPDTQFSMPEEMNAKLTFYTYGAFAAIGAFVMLAPRIASGIVGLDCIMTNGYASIRSASGFALGAALTGMALANPMMDLGFGAALVMAVLGRVLALVFNRGNYVYALLMAIAQGAAAALIISGIMVMM